MIGNILDSGCCADQGAGLPQLRMAASSIGELAQMFKGSLESGCCRLMNWR